MVIQGENWICDTFSNDKNLCLPPWHENKRLSSLGVNVFDYPATGSGGEDCCIWVKFSYVEKINKYLCLPFCAFICGTDFRGIVLHIFRCKPMDGEECEPFTDVYWIKFRLVSNARWLNKCICFDCYVTQLVLRSMLANVLTCL